MNDCFWAMAGACTEKCKCHKYLSMNSNDGTEKVEEYDRTVERTLIPVKHKYENEFKTYKRRTKIYNKK